MNSQFTTTNLPSSLIPYYLKDPVVRTIVDSFRESDKFEYATMENLLETICVAVLRVKDDYFKLLLDYAHHSTPLPLIK